VKESTPCGEEGGVRRVPVRGDRGSEDKRRPSGEKPAVAKPRVGTELHPVGLSMADPRPQEDWEEW